MAADLHTLRPAQGSTKRVRRVGRGHGSGRGKTSGRGTKGQRARSGGTKGLKRLGLRRMVLSIPKERGFHHASPTMRELRWDDINAAASAGTIITRALLEQRGIVRANEKVKIINTGVLKHQGMTIIGIAMTKGAREHLLSKGGTIQK